MKIARPATVSRPSTATAMNGIKAPTLFISEAVKSLIEGSALDTRVSVSGVR